MADIAWLTFGQSRVRCGAVRRADGGDEVFGLPGHTPSGAVAPRVYACRTNRTAWRKWRYRPAGPTCWGLFALSTRRRMTCGGGRGLSVSQPFGMRRALAPLRVVAVESRVFMCHVTVYGQMWAHVLVLLSGCVADVVVGGAPPD